MPNELVKNWFGGQFNDLHPLLQQLHTDGGSLTGDIDIAYGKGLAGIIGGRLAKKMKLAFRMILTAYTGDAVSIIRVL